MLRPTARLWRLALLAALAGAPGCDLGEPADQASGETRSIALESPATPRRARRLSDAELDNVLRDLAGGTLPPASRPMIGDSRVDGYDSDDSFIVSDPKLESYLERAEDAAPAIVAANPCVTVAEPRDCARELARTIATKAFGRPTTDEEIEELLRAYDTGAVTSHARGLELLAQAVIVAPSTLYRSEIGPAAKRGDIEVVLDDYEIASQLSFLFDGSRPDDELRAAAARGELHDPAKVRAQAERLLRGPRAEATLRRFFLGWLELGRFGDTRLGPAVELFTPAMRSAMLREAESFIDHVVRRGEGTFDDLMLSSTSYPGAELLWVYGTDLLDLPGNGTPVRLDPRHRKGVLTLPAFLTSSSVGEQTNPVQRGLFVLSRLLCVDLGNPPPDVVMKGLAPPPPDLVQTTRARFEKHTSEGRCRRCHQHIDPAGFGFESFDIIGRHRTHENGFEVDDSGQLAIADVNATFHGPAELAEILVKSRDARRCFVSQAYRFAEGRPVAEPALLAPMVSDFDAGGGKLASALLAYVTRREFFVRRVLPETSP